MYRPVCPGLCTSMMHTMNDNTPITIHPHRVGINAHLLADEESYRQAGVSRYIQGLATHIPLQDPEGDYLLYLRDRPAFVSGARTVRTRMPTHQPWVRVLWEQLAEPWRARVDSLDLLHSPVNVQPFSLPCKSIVTITDLSFEMFGETFRASQRWYQRFFTRQTALRADHLITYSLRTARDVSNWYGVSQHKISVTNPGVDEAYRVVNSGDELATFRSRRKLPEHFILFVGTLEPRKNLSLLVKAYAEAKHSTQFGWKLVLAGGTGWLAQPLFATVEALGLNDDVIFPGFIPEDELPLWYNAAELFVYPSLYEGFGLPPLEAMACGTAVLASDASSIPEVVGGAGMLVDPRLGDAWTEALVFLYQHPERRKEMSERGLQRAKEFSWDNMARETILAYRTTLSGSR